MTVGVFESGVASWLRRSPVGNRPTSVATGLGAVWVANVDDDSVSRIDPKTNAVVQTITVGEQSSGVAVGGGFVWVANTLDGTVSQIDPGRERGRRTIPVGKPARPVSRTAGAACGSRTRATGR